MCAFTLLFSSLAYSKDDTYLCIAEESTGFYFENGKWGQAKFDVSEEKFLIRKIKTHEVGYVDKKNNYGIYPLGENYSVHVCEQNQRTKKMICNGITGKIFFSPTSGRFLKSYIFGYWEGIDNNTNTPHLMRGRCSKI